MLESWCHGDWWETFKQAQEGNSLQTCVLRCLEVLYDFGIPSLHTKNDIRRHQYPVYRCIQHIVGLWQVFRNELEAERLCRSPLLGYSLVQKAKVKRPHCSIHFHTVHTVPLCSPQASSGNLMSTSTESETKKVLQPGCSQVKQCVGAMCNTQHIFDCFQPGLDAATQNCTTM